MFIKYFFPCCFNNEDELNDDTQYQHNIDENNDIKKLNKIISKKKTVKKNEYFYENIKILKLELNSNFYVKVIDVYDADTITVILFFRNYPSIVKLRLYGIDTPELKPNTNNDNDKIKEKALAIIAKVILLDIIKKNNNILFIETKGFEKYGRTLATLYLKKNDKYSINEKLIDLKLADKYYGQKKEKIFQKNYLSLDESKKIIKIYENKNLYSDEILINFKKNVTKFPIF